MDALSFYAIAFRQTSTEECSISWKVVLLFTSAEFVISHRRVSYTFMELRVSHLRTIKILLGQKFSFHI